MTSEIEARDFAEAVDGLAPVAVRAAASLRIADHIVDGTADLHALAECSGSDPAVLAKLMRFLVCRGVFAEPEPSRFALTALSVGLLDNHPSGLRRLLDSTGIGAKMDRAIAGLDLALRTGRSPYAALHGAPFYQDLARTHVHGSSFDQIRAQHAESFASELAANYDWPPSGHVVDVGGGTGAVVAALLSTYPGMSATLLDMPDTVTAGMRRIDQTGLSARCSPAPGSFFEPLPPGADIYLLVNVLHNWNDEDATIILRNCASASHAETATLIIERLTDSDDARTMSSMDLRMFLIVGGQERSAEEFSRLAGAAGLTITKKTSLPSGLRILKFRLQEVTCPAL
jgi:2,7-dihydroxy-5-methyl-1-naphthoate 7-O-methyltransferase